MALQMQRHRSSHSVRSMNRPLSRASTTSAASPAPESFQHDMKYAQSQFMPHGADVALMQYTDQNGAPIDPMLQHSFQMHPLQTSMDPYPRSYTPQDSPYMMQNPEFPMQIPSNVSISGLEQDDRRRKNSTATATNDKELRELLLRNELRALKDVAQEVIQKERTPQAEKTKQLFAMLWLRKVCKAAKTSVPRNRVYSHYANRCGTERVVPLNPASFGKLVRVIFPGIQTRRLGVRGESKYHYVDLCLIDEEADQSSANWAVNSFAMDQSDLRRSASAGQLDFGSLPRLPADTAAFPSHDVTTDLQPPPQPDTRGPPSQGKLFAYPDTRGMVPDNEGSLMYEQYLRFPVKEDSTFQENDSIALPNIHPYCPPKTDADTAEALTALYRTHCTSLIDCIRFCKEKQFFRLFTSFHGTLTVPVQKLFGHPNLAPWIQECDFLMYQQMVRFVSRLTLQAAPPVVITILNNISTNLHAHIQKTFQSHPVHVLAAKLKPAATFASLLHRLIRVNAAAHAAANLLTIDQNREQMWREWVTMVNPKRVMEGELPDCGYEEVYKILTCDIRGLLEPLNSPPFPDNAMFSLDNQAYGFAQGGFPNVYQNVPMQSNDQTGQVSTENVLDRWSTFLSGLPSRFPNASTRTLLNCISAIGTAALRDITIMGGASYQTWWVMKIFVDEMALWLAAMGGFLERKPTEPISVPVSSVQSPVLRNGLIRSQSARSVTESRMSSIEADFNLSQSMDNQVPPSRPLNGKLTRTHSTQSMHSLQSYNQSFDMAVHGLPMQQEHQQQQMTQQQMSQQQSQQFAHMMMQQQQQQQHMQPQLHVQTHMRNVQMATPQDTDIDDSGIGMGLMDDELALAKFGAMNGHGGHELVGGEMGVM